MCGCRLIIADTRPVQPHYPNPISRSTNNLKGWSPALIKHAAGGPFFLQRGSRDLAYSAISVSPRVPARWGRALSGSRADKAARDPSPKLLMVHTAVSPDVLDPDAAETVALWTALVNQLGRNG